MSRSFFISSRHILDKRNREERNMRRRMSDFFSFSAISILFYLSIFSGLLCLFYLRWWLVAIFLGGAVAAAALVLVLSLAFPIQNEEGDEFLPLPLWLSLPLPVITYFIMIFLTEGVLPGVFFSTGMFIGLFSAECYRYSRYCRIHDRQHDPQPNEQLEKQLDA